MRTTQLYQSFLINTQQKKYGPNLIKLIETHFVPTNQQSKRNFTHRRALEVQIVIEKVTEIVENS